VNLRDRTRALAMSGLASSTLSGLTGALVVRVAGFGRQVVTARAFGLGPELDAFLLAALIPTLVGGVAGPAISTALVPRLTSHTGPDSEERLRGRLWLAVAYTGLLGAAIAIALFALADPLSRLVVSGDGVNVESVARTIRILAAVPMLVMVYEVISAGLVSKQRFASATALPVFTPIAIAVAVVSGVRTAEGLARASVMGGVLVVIAGLVVASRLVGGPSLGALHRPSSLGRIARDVAGLTTAMILAQATIFIDKLMASSLGTGSVSALEFGSRVPEAVIGVTALGVANAIAQRSGLLASKGDLAELSYLMRSLGRAIAVVGTTLAAILILASPWLVDVIFVGQSFTTADADVVIRVQIAYLFQIPFYLAAIVASRVFASIQRVRWITISTLAHLVLSVSGNLILMGPFGVSGIAAATSVSFALTGLTAWGIALHALRPTRASNT
jgi:putative peptidoglycan lipid II flippase